MRRTWLVVALLVLAGGLWFYTSARHTVWVGFYDLTVHVSSDAGPVRSVRCQPFLGTRDYPDDVAAGRLPPETDTFAVSANPFAGEPLTVHVKVIGSDSMSGRTLSRLQCNHLVVTGELADGRRVGKRVDIPDGRVTTEVHVTLP